MLTKIPEFQIFFIKDASTYSEAIVLLSVWK